MLDYYFPNETITRLLYKKEKKRSHRHILHMIILIDTTKKGNTIFSVKHYGLYAPKFLTIGASLVKQKKKNFV